MVLNLERPEFERSALERSELDMSRVEDAINCPSDK
jgi:hypothetical protein